MKPTSAFDATLGLDGKSAIITGGSKGIGLAIARQFAAAGASICLVARESEGLDAANRSLQELGADVTMVCGDLRSGATLAEAVRATMDNHGRIDILVNNAATTEPRGPVIEVSQEEFGAGIRLNLAAPLELTQLAWRAWMREHGGVVLNISSVAGLRPRRDIGAYGTTKAALTYLTQQLALELGPQVRVNAIAPGLVRTDLAAATITEAQQASALERPLGRLGEPVDIARAALFLCSAASDWTTGEVLIADGGAYVST